MFDWTKLTQGEIEYAERQSGVSMKTMEDMDKPVMGFQIGLAMIVKRRIGEPGFTYNQAQAMTIEEAQDVLERFDPVTNTLLPRVEEGTEDFTPDVEQPTGTPPLEPSKTNVLPPSSSESESALTTTTP